jgi:hypothetical protein
MKPDYALSLSLDGIKFLCRVKGGWHHLGDVPLEHADLDAALKELRLLGEEHAGGDALCKIILPNDQIKYLTLPDVDGDQDAAIADAIEAATPYTLDEIAYDFVETVEGVQIAAVARETLNEALDFAQEHGFQAVSFTAIPDAKSFDAEPFFGATPAAASLVDDVESIGPDDAPVFVVSDGPLPEAEAEDQSEPPAAFSTSRFSAQQPEPEIAAKLGGVSRDLEPKAQASEEQTDNKPDEDAQAANLAASLERAALDAKKDTAVPEAPKVDNPTPAPAPENGLAAQQNRFDPAAVIAGLKNRPEAAGDGRARGAARATGAGSATPEKTGSRAPKSKTAAKGIKTVQAEPKVGGKPRYLGAILVLILLVFMAGVALWASRTSEDGLAGLFSPNRAIETIPIEAAEPAEELETTTLPPVSETSITDTAEIEALDEEEGELIDPVMDAVIQTATGDALYAATGIWDRAPAQPNTPSSESSEAIYIASFETLQQTHDAIALPTLASFNIDAVLPRQNNPVGAGTRFDLDARGLVVATADGAISPEGIMVYLGKPAVVPAAFPVRQAVQEPEPEAIAPEVARLAVFRPKLRPTDLVEQNERATLGGSTLSEIARIRPKLRPDGLVKLVSIDPNAIQSATDQAILASVRPKARPNNFASTVAKQQERLASTPVPSTESVAPTIPSRASVARNATQENAINLRKVNLIGVYGASNDRRALVRLSSGRYKKVQIGDRIDGGKVAAINSNELHYVKSGRTIVLKMPRG